ncbi:MAG: phosphoribosylformylglycinamidine synthase subunit PurQ [Candidatus Auribacterota bacterium]|nr:phosphoribosylformylglycinamidine synthase subunit PurQ [Candidatus Auribacterota bacterium]
MRFGVVVFPGSNCDHDCFYAIKQFVSKDVEFIWHKSREIHEFDCIVIPGGFSYGDYLRTGAIARFSPVIGQIREFAESGKLVIGICNGFQILLECGLLPGAMLRNTSLRFICKYIYLKTVNSDTPFTSSMEQGRVIRIPIAHGEGNYYIDPDGLAELKRNNQIVFQYCDANGNISDNTNPNGSVENIAGICNKAGNVLGMMPHPERCCDPRLGSSDGLAVFQSILKSLTVSQ